MLLSACSRSSFEGELSTIDSLITEYHELQILADSMSVNDVSLKFKEYEHLFHQTKEELKNVKVNDLNDLSFMNDFKIVKRGLKGFEDKKKGLQKELSTNFKELNKLKNDISNKVYKSDQIKHFIQSEKSAFNKLKHKTFETNKKASKSTKLLDSLQSSIALKLEALKSQ